MEKTGAIIQPPARFAFNFKELWQYRELLYFFAWRDIKVRYKQTILGIFWALLQPLSLMLLFTVIFSKTSVSENTGDIPYAVFVLSGLVTWNLFHASVSHAADSMVVNASIIKKIYFPRLLIPLSNLLTALIDFFIAFLFFIIICLAYGQPFDIQATVFFPASVLLCQIAALGMGSFLGALNVKYRDFRYALPFLLQVLFFLSQVIYSMKHVFSSEWKFLLSLNPMNAVIEIFRGGLGLPVDKLVVATGFSTAIILLFTGLWYFKKTENYFADIA